MSKAEFVIWKVESMEQIKRDHPEFTKEQQRRYLGMVARAILKDHPDFFGEFKKEFIA